MKRKIHDIVLVGAGNVATQLGKTLESKGYRIIQVYSRTLGSARTLSARLGASCTTDINSLNYDAQLYLFCLKDDALFPLLCQTCFTNHLLVHTSGTLPLNIFQDFSENHGVIYPVQTFSKEWQPDLGNTPFCIEASNPEVERILGSIVSDISRKIIFTHGEQRKLLHLAAVFACNFPNHMYLLAENILRQTDLPFDLLKPLILETAQKVMELDPFIAQTGPAVRGDRKTLEEHRQMLKHLPGIQKIYTFVSNSISSQRKARR